MATVLSLIASPLGSQNIENIDVKKNYLLKSEWTSLQEAGPPGQAKMKQFYLNFLRTYQAQIETHAAVEGLPDWLLTGVILGERIDMDETFGIDEPNRELILGVGSSVGLAQIRAETAIKYGLTNSARVYYLATEGANAAFKAGEMSLTADLSSEAFAAFTQIRPELLRDRASIRASAKYLRILATQALTAAKRAGNSSAPASKRVFEQFGRFRWTDVTSLDSQKAWDQLAQSAYPDRPLTFARACLVGFFGAAHNDDKVTGKLDPKVGGGQGQNAYSVARDLSRMGLMEIAEILSPRTGEKISVRVTTIRGRVSGRRFRRAFLYQNGEPQRVEVVDGEFAQKIGLVPGRNKFYVRAVDSKGFKTATSNDVDVYADIPRQEVRIVLTWDTAGTDVDLHVVEPSGEECFYKHKSTRSGGSLDTDDRDGFGPETYVLERAPDGLYTISVVYFASRGRGSTKCSITFTWPNGRRSVHRVLLHRDKERVVVTELHY